MMTPRKYVHALLIILLSSNLAIAQDYFSEVVDSNWIGNGTLMGNEANFEMNWSRVLNNNFIKLEFKNTRGVDDKKIQFTATALYQVSNDTIVKGHWFDSRGVSFPLKGNVKDKELTVHWGTPETEQGRTTYTIEKGKITVKDFILRNEEYFQFGQAVYGND